jgi:hypothetical protein
MIILSKKFEHDSQDFEIFIKYDEVAKRPIEVKNIMLHTHGNWYPMGGIMTMFFKEAVWKLIMETKWEVVRAELEKQFKPYKELLGDLHPVIQSVFGPFVVTGGDIKETYH